MFWKRKQVGPEYVKVKDSCGKCAVKRCRDGRLLVVGCMGDILWEKPTETLEAFCRTDEECDMIISRLTA